MLIILVGLVVFLPEISSGRDLLIYNDPENKPPLLGSEEVIATFAIRTVWEQTPQEPIGGVPVRMRLESNGDWAYTTTCSCEECETFGWAYADILVEGTFRIEGSGCMIDDNPPEYYQDCVKIITFYEDDDIVTKCPMCYSWIPEPYEFRGW